MGHVIDKRTYFFAFALLSINLLAEHSTPNGLRPQVSTQPLLSNNERLNQLLSACTAGRAFPPLASGSFSIPPSFPTENIPRSPESPTQAPPVPTPRPSSTPTPIVIPRSPVPTPTPSPSASSHPRTADELNHGMKEIFKQSCMGCHQAGSIFDASGGLLSPSLRFRVASILSGQEEPPKQMEGIVQTVMNNLAAPGRKGDREILAEWMRKTLEAPVARLPEASVAEGMKKIVRDNCLLCHSENSVFGSDGRLLYPSLRFRVANIISGREAPPKGMETVVSEMNSYLAKPENATDREALRRWLDQVGSLSEFGKFVK